jgi:hypothetical protein
VADSWLFCNGGSSVRITRMGALAVAVCGPGRIRRFLSFLSDTELAVYLRKMEQTLASTGFHFRGFAADRRRRAERRDLPRGPDRRSPAPW